MCFFRIEILYFEGKCKTTKTFVHAKRLATPSVTGHCTWSRRKIAKQKTCRWLLMRTETLYSHLWLSSEWGDKTKDTADQINITKLLNNEHFHKFYPEKSTIEGQIETILMLFFIITILIALPPKCFKSFKRILGFKKKMFSSCHYNLHVLFHCIDSNMAQLHIIWRLDRITEQTL